MVLWGEVEGRTESEEGGEKDEEGCAEDGRKGEER